MDRHFLITVSDQKSALYGARFVGDFFPDKTNIKTTLFFSGPQTNPVANLKKELQAKGEQALEQAGTILIEKGFSENNIMYKSRSSVLSTVTDIIQRRNLRDILLMARN